MKRQFGRTRRSAARRALGSIVFVVMLAAGSAVPAAARSTVVASPSDVQVGTNHAEVAALAFDGQGTVPPPETVAASDFTEFSETASVFDDPTQGRTAEAQATQNTTVDGTQQSIEMSTEGVVRASWGDSQPGDAAAPAGRGNTEFSMTFEIAGDPAPFSLNGGIAATADTSNAECSVVELTSPSGSSFEVSSPDDCGGPDQRIVDDGGELAPGTYTVSVDAVAPASNADAGGGTAEAGFELHLLVGCGNEFTSDADIITGTPGDDVLCGGSGNDSIDGLGGNDTIIGGAGSDSIIGGDDNDTIEGGDDEDFIQGGSGNDSIDAGGGDDGDFDAAISGGAGDDFIEGGAGQDTISGDLGNDVIEGGDGSKDLIRGCNFDDPLCDASQAELDAAGVSDADTIRAGDGGSIISAGAGNDLVGGGAGFDEISGDAGNDFVIALGAGDAVKGGEGNDHLEGGGGHESGTREGVARGVFGGSGNDTIRGETGDDLLEGGDGRDEMFGNAGSDKMRGQDGPDCLTGGTRKDVFVGGGGNDKLFSRDNVRDEVHGNGGTDRARIDQGVDDVDGVENDNFQGSC